MVVNNRLGYLFVFLGMSMALYAQRKTEVIRYGDLDQWVVRKITESAIIGKETKTLYCVGPTDTGIESISAMGIMNVKVLVGGCLYLGRFLEPAKNSSETWGQIVCGIPFHQKPTSLLFDYKVKLSGDPNRIKLSGFSKRSEVNGIDMPLVNLFLQKRWEDKDGNIYAKRIGTLVIRMDKNTDWVNDANFTILYGDITKRSDYKEYMGFQLGESARYSLNSKGKNVPVQEIGWGTEDDEVTHMILEFCSSHGGSYIGSPGNTFWVDNIRLGY